jgi:AcrR family transcriptional regulator
MTRGSRAKEGGQRPDDDTVRRRILGAAFAAFVENGYAETSTLEIATRAQVSKATLYSLVGNKQQMLAACIRDRVKRFEAPHDLAVPDDRESLAHALASFGERLLRELSDPTVIAVFRLAIAEAVRAPAVAQALDSIGVEASRAALRAIMSGAQSAGVLSGQPDKMADQYIGLLWGGLMVGLLLRVVERPGPREIARRAADATTAFLKLHQRQ